MSGETSEKESGWTVDTLKEYVIQRFIDNQKAVDAALVSQEKAEQIILNLNDRRGVDIDFDEDIMEDIYQEIIEVIESK